MSALRESVDDYLQIRRAVGYKLTIHGRVLPQFARFLEQKDASVITTSLALEFATQPHDASVVWWHQRLAIVRGFALYMQAIDPRTEVPPADLLPAKFRRATPYLYSEADVESLMGAARKIRSALKAATYETLIGLLAVTGMRIGELIALDRGEVELPEGQLTVCHGKNGRSREVALHPSTVMALEAYARLRDERCPHPKDPSFLAPCVRAAHPARLVSRRCRCRGAAAAALNVPGACGPVVDLLVLRGRAAAADTRLRAARADLGAAVMTPLALLLQAFFAERLARQRGASPHTIAADRDGCRLLPGFLHEQTGKKPSKLARRPRRRENRHVPRSS